MPTSAIREIVNWPASCDAMVSSFWRGNFRTCAGSPSPFGLCESGPVPRLRPSTAGRATRAAYAADQTWLDTSSAALRVNFTRPGPSPAILATAARRASRNGGGAFLRLSCFNREFDWRRLYLARPELFRDAGRVDLV